MSGIRTADKLKRPWLLLHKNQHVAGMEYNNFNLHEVRHLPVFQISYSTLILSDKRGNTFVSVTTFYWSIVTFALWESVIALSYFWNSELVFSSLF